MFESESINERAGFKIGQKLLTFMVPRKEGVIFIRCSTGGDASSGIEAIRRHYDEVKPLFLLISASCVFPDKWKTP
jgi:hypothetical protein